MDLQPALQFLKDIVPFIAAFSATMAWIAKLRWADEFKQAKEEQIKALEAKLEAELSIKEAEMAGLKEKIDFLENISSEQVKEHFKNTKQYLEAYNNELKDALQTKEDLITSLQNQNKSLTADHQKTIARIEELKSEKELLKIKITQIEKEQKTVEAVEEKLIFKASTASGSGTANPATFTTDNHRTNSNKKRTQSIKEIILIASKVPTQLTPFAIMLNSLINERE